MGTPESQVTGASPSPAYVWMSGHWNSESGQWKWVAAHWELPPSRSAVWIEGHWMASGSTWVWSNGAWNVGAPTQTSATPPQLPTQSTADIAAQEQGVPMPYTPPPTVNGQFVQGSQAQGAQVPVIDQAPVVTEYGADYAAPYYPGYYWTGNTWLWGGYPGYYGFGLGIGPVIFDWGRGGGFRGGGFHGGGFSGHGGGHFR
jgi:hypothetical protein